MQDERYHRAMKQLALEWMRAWEQLARTMEEAQQAMEAYAAQLTLLRWRRFDTLYGPIIGGVMIIGILIISGLCAYWSVL